MNRRRFLSATASLAIACLAGPAFAGSYLDRAALLLDQARKEGDLLQPRTGDKELALVIKTLSEARAKAARKMEVPAAIAKAHPHLLLVMEVWDRAVESALEGNFKKFMEHLLTAREEDRIFRALVKELGFAIPDLAERR